MPKRTKQNKYIVARDVKGKKHKFLVKDYSFRPGIYAVIIKNGQILLSPQWDGYDFPGGGVKINETLDQAFEREVKEETGLKVKRGELVFVKNEFFKSDFSKKPWNSVNIYCLAKNVTGQVSDKFLDADEKNYVKKAEWVSLKRIKKLKFYNSGNSVEIIRKAIKTLSHPERQRRI